MSKRFIYINSIEKCINQFAIGYMVNPKLHVTMTGIINAMKNNTCVTVLVIFYDNRTNNTMKFYRFLSGVLYSVIENYVCNNYLCCHSKKLSVISSDKIFGEASYNELLGIGIPEVLMNLVSCHGFMKKPNSTVILVCRYSLENYYLGKFLLLLNTTLSS